MISSLFWLFQLGVLHSTEPWQQEGQTDSPVPVEELHAKYDCGVLALFTLLRLEGSQLSLREVRARLPSASVDGFSFEQLRNVAALFGVRLLGVKIGGKLSQLDRPALVLLGTGRHGHFAIVRPVGRTGKLIQLIDSVTGEFVLDTAHLLAHPGWTGLALIPERPNWPARIAGALAVALGLALAAMIVVPRLRRKRHVLAGSSPPAS
jgi:hypothetical protein